jgi:hypothetical protein
VAAVKRIVCLANSRKHEGRCVAGREWDKDNIASWVRPVSARPDEELSIPEVRYRNGEEPQLLDIVEMQLIEARPKDHQPENWLNDGSRHWEKNGELRWRDLERLVDRVAPLWSDGSSSQGFLNNRVAAAEAKAVHDSLRLIRVDQLWIRVYETGGRYSKRRVQARFRHAEVEYRLAVTDPDVEQTYRAKPNGCYQLGESYLTISLGELYKGYCYKLAAAIFPPKRGGWA